MDYNKLKEIKDKFVKEYFYKFPELSMVRLDIESNGLLVGAKDQKTLDCIPDKFEGVKIKKEIIDIIPH